MKDTKRESKVTKIKLKNSNAEVTKVEQLVKRMCKPSRDIACMVEYVKALCGNCEGGFYCLNGQVVGKRPKDGTKISLKNAGYKIRYQNNDHILVDHNTTGIV